MLENIAKYNVVLGSNSPRRKELLSGLGVAFEVRPMPEIDESYPSSLPNEEVALYVANKKAEAYAPFMTDETLLITADTVVCCKGTIFGKPSSCEDAAMMLRSLSGCSHEVITGVVLATTRQTERFSVSTKVFFSPLTDQEIDYYIKTFQPYDKAGAYGIQEWIGFVAIERIEGSYFNVVGLPVQRLYRALRRF